MTAVPVDSHHPDPTEPFTVEDLERTPDDGRRYELLDGVLLVTPAPGTRHQKVVIKLGALLDAYCPIDLHVLSAPFAVQTSGNTEMQPDVLVARDEDLTEKLLPVGPLLAVEVLSPSTTLVDVNLKKAAYQRMGTPSYWIIDPIEARLMAFELDESAEYVQVADVKGEDVFETDRPYPVRIVPSELLGTLWRKP